ncbi:MAG: cupin domain-containing protein [Candidatus Methylomirabilales bacterium]
MKIEIKLFASLRKLLPPDADGSAATIEIEDGLTVAGLLEHLKVPEELAQLVLVNGANIEGDYARTLQEGDTVSVFPPVAGGIDYPHFPDLDNAPEKEIAPGVKIRVAWGDKIMLSRVLLEPGSRVPMHSHPHEQAGLVLEGEFDFTIGNETRRVRSGDTYFIPGGVTHGCLACAGRAVALDIFTPPREDYMK